MPKSVRERYPIVRSADIERLRGALQRSGISVFNLEVFPISHDITPGELEKGIALGAALGGCHATVHVHIEDRVTAIPLFRDFCAMTAERNIKVGLEYNGFSAIRSPFEASNFLNNANCSNAGIVADLLHTARSGAGPPELAALQSQIDYVQISDGPMEIPADRRWREALSERLLPGAGELPLRAMLAALADDIVIDIEVPRLSASSAGISRYKRVHEAVKATRKLLVSGPN